MRKQEELQRWCKAKCYQSIVTDATRFLFICLLRGPSEAAPSSLNADAESTSLMIGILDSFRITAFPNRRPRHRVASLRLVSGAVTLLAVFYQVHVCHPRLMFLNGLQLVFLISMTAVGILRDFIRALSKFLRCFSDRGRKSHEIHVRVTVHQRERQLQRYFTAHCRHKQLDLKKKRINWES